MNIKAFRFAKAFFYVLRKPSIPMNNRTQPTREATAAPIYQGLKSEPSGKKSANELTAITELTTMTPPIMAIRTFLLDDVDDMPPPNFYLEWQIQ